MFRKYIFPLSDCVFNTFFSVSAYSPLDYYHLPYCCLSLSLCFRSAAVESPLGWLQSPWAYIARPTAGFTQRHGSKHSLGNQRPSYSKSRWALRKIRRKINCVANNTSVLNVSIKFLGWKWKELSLSMSYLNFLWKQEMQTSSEKY